MIDNIKDILIGITEEGKDEPVAALGYGLSLANASGAHVTIQAASAKLVLTHAFVSGFVASLVAEENRRRHLLTEEIIEKARGDAASDGIVCSVENPQLPYHRLLETFVAQARVHDLTVLDSEQYALDIDRNLIEAVLFGSGRPVIVVPPGCDQFTGQRLMVAWDGSARASKSLNDALPLLRAAAIVEILSIASDDELQGSIPGADVAPHLARHGVNVSVKNVRQSGIDIAEVIEEETSLFKADLVVMGAFTHSLTRERLLGGVTQTLLNTSRRPLFLAH